MGASSGDASDFVELRGDHQDVLAFNFPLVGNGGSLSVGLDRVPAVSGVGPHQLPPGIDWMRLRHVAGFRDRLPKNRGIHQGVMAPIREDEGMYISRCASGDCDFAVCLGPVKFCVVTGKPWDPTLTGKDGKGQNYISPQIQARLDGFCEGHGQVSQFVGVPLHGGETMEERLSGRAGHGGLQIQAIPIPIRPTRS